MVSCLLWYFKLALVLCARCQKCDAWAKTDVIGVIVAQGSGHVNSASRSCLGILSQFYVYFLTYLCIFQVVLPHIDTHMVDIRRIVHKGGFRGALLY